MSKWFTMARLSDGLVKQCKFNTETEADKYTKRVLTDDPEHHPVYVSVTQYEWLNECNAYTKRGTWYRSDFV